jgi:Zn-dependent protease with chaperone function
MRRLALPLLFCSLLLAISPAEGGPQDTRVGETRVLYNKAGTTIRATATATGAAVATLAAGTQVRVLEVTLPWVRVSATPAGGAAVEGWLRAYEAVEPTALSANPPPAHTVVAAAGTADARDVTAAGRQLTAGTERGYRASRAELEAAYLQVDRLERDTAAMDPMDSIAFFMDGDLGRRGRDCQLPPRKPAGDKLNEGRKRGGDVGDTIGKVGGEIFKRIGGKSKDAEKVAKLIGGATDYFQDLEKQFSPGQEYYLGRAVAATAIAKYGVERDDNLRRYVRQVGDAVVRLTSRVGGTFGGYHFEVLATDEVNGVAGPGGYVLVTRGAVKACRTEDELAAILCHELAHVERKDGEAVLRRGKNFQATVKAAGSAVSTLTDVGDSRIGGELLKVFTQAVGEMSRTAIEHGYGRELEFAADRDATYLLHDVYYDWNGMRSYLMGMSAAHTAHAGATHADPAARAAALDAVLPSLGAYPPRPVEGDARLSRLRAALGARPAGK